MGRISDRNNAPCSKASTYARPTSLHFPPAVPLMQPMTDLAELLACPRSDQPLKATDEGFVSTGGTAFPRVGGVPWLFADPDTARMEWRLRYHLAREKLQRDHARVTAALDGDVPAGTRTRLEHQASAYAAHLEELDALLAPLGLSTQGPAYESHLALRTRMPTDQGLNTYYANVHRDWCWGDAENGPSHDRVAAALDIAAGDNVLVLGAGAGRLAYDLHQSSEAATTLALDFNPLLMLVAQRLAAGEEVSLHEFPIAPKSASDVAVAQTLSAPAAARDGFVPLLGSALRPPIRAGSMQRLVTPWLVDILPEDFALQAARWNRLLANGGRWVIFGSLAFRNEDPAHNYGVEEVTTTLTANGFGNVKAEEITLPYMASPHSRHARQEQVVVISADKTADVKAPARHVALPDWIVTGDKPVPQLEGIKVQALSTRVYAFVLALVDGKRSIKDMAKMLEQQQLMTAADGEVAIRNFLIKVFEEANRQGTF